MKGFPDLPPVWLLGSAVISWLLARLIPVVVLDLPSWLGWALVALGLIWAGSAAGLFLQKNTPVEPRNTPSVLLVDYHFRINRNPIYTGMTVMLLGWAVVLGAITAFFPVLAFPIIITRRFILDEEKALRDTFGQQATDYLGRSRRW